MHADLKMREFVALGESTLRHVSAAIDADANEVRIIIQPKNGAPVEPLKFGVHDRKLDGELRDALRQLEVDHGVATAHNDFLADSILAWLRGEGVITA